MEIKRELFGQEVSIALSDKELNAAYQEYKKNLDYEEVKDFMLVWDLGEVLKSCGFPYLSYAYLSNEKTEEAENRILDNKELLLCIYDEFHSEIEKSNFDKVTLRSEMFIQTASDNMKYACDKVLEKWGKENPDFLKQFEGIEVIAYKKYRENWIKERNYSDEFLKELREAFNDEYISYNEPSCFEEYIDEYGYGGELYVCIDEFLDAEYQDQEFMKELLNTAEYVEYLNDLGLEVQIQDLASLYEIDEPIYLTNAMGEYDAGKEPPEAPYQWYENLGVGTGSLLYLVNLRGEIGVLAINEYDDCYCEDIFQKKRELMSAFVSEKAEELSQNENLKGYQILKGIRTGFDGCDEIGLFIPYPTEKEKVQKLLCTLDEIGYEGDKEFVEKKVLSQQDKMFRKEYANYSVLRKSLQNNTYDMMQDSLGQLIRGEYSTDITVKDYDGVVCIDYDVYMRDGDINRHLDGGRVCRVIDLPEKEIDFICMIRKAFNKHLEVGNSKNVSLDEQMENAGSSISSQAMAVHKKSEMER